MKNNIHVEKMSQVSLTEKIDHIYAGSIVEPFVRPLNH